MTGLRIKFISVRAERTAGLTCRPTGHFDGICTVNGGLSTGVCETAVRIACHLVALSLWIYRSLLWLSSGPGTPLSSSA